MIDKAPINLKVTFFFAKLAINNRFDLVPILIRTIVGFLLTYILWQAALADNVVDGFDNQKMGTYLALGHILSTFISEPQSTIRIASQLRSGKLDDDLTKPISFMRWNFLQDLGEGYARLLFVTVPFALVCRLTGFIEPGVLSTNLMGISTVVLGYILSWSTSYLLGVICFWTIAPRGIVNANRLLSGILSGVLIPLQFLPIPVQNISKYLPYQFMIYEPIRIFLGDNIKFKLQVVILQLTWILIILVISKLLLHVALKKYSSTGT